jgi:hypothetical protein
MSKVFDSVCLSVPQECCFAGPCKNKQIDQEKRGRIRERGIRGSGIGKGDIGEGGLVFAFNLRKKAPRYHSATCRGMSQTCPLVPLMGSSNLALKLMYLFYSHAVSIFRALVQIFSRTGIFTEQSLNERQLHV